jgi:photosystem II stability/assembly factor-like uncharacterized protein
MSRLHRAVLAVFATGALVAGCGSDDPGVTRDRPIVHDPGPVHVHGLGINPKDGALFIATHTGLFRAGSDEQSATRVGDRYQDTMGFTVVGPDRFLGSGHPDTRDGLPPFLGLIRSGDAGKNWDSVSLMGKADFHVLEAAGERVYGFGTDFDTRKPQFTVSGDGGRTWDQKEIPAILVALAIDPRDPDSIVASTGRALFASDTAGHKWRRLGGPGGLLAWTPNDQLTVIKGDGKVFARDRADAKFTKHGDIGGLPAALGGDVLLVAFHDGTVKRSTDGGRTWQVRSRPAAVSSAPAPG